MDDVPMNNKKFNYDIARTGRVCTRAPNPHAPKDCTEPAKCANGPRILTPVQQRPDGAHTEVPPDSQPIVIDYIGLLPRPKK